MYCAVNETKDEGILTVPMTTVVQYLRLHVEGTSQYTVKRPIQALFMPKFEDLRLDLTM